MADRSLFEDVADALRGLAPDGVGPLRTSHHRYGIKLWTDSDRPGREHYEAQVVGRQYAPGAAVLALEIGFHAEHPSEADNQEVIDRLAGSERRWRRRLGSEPCLGPFLGRAEHWRRLSEVWPDPDLSDPELVFEVADRLTDYVTVLQPLVAGTAAPAGRARGRR